MYPIIGKLNYMCGAAISEYMGTGTDRDEKYLKSIFVREDISCARKNELPYYSVDFYPQICIHCGMQGTSRKNFILSVLRAMISQTFLEEREKL